MDIFDLLIPSVDIKTISALVESGKDYSAQDVLESFLKQYGEKLDEDKFIFALIVLFNCLKSE
jgi:hypothetical protein